MDLGIFAKTFARSSLAECYDAVRGQGLRCVQFNFACAGLPALPDAVPDDLCDTVRTQAEARGIRLAAVSGTYNMAHPDPGRRAADTQRFGAVVAAARRIGAPVVTLCTGSRNAQDMWRAHPGNDATDAWQDLCRSLEQALAYAEAEEVSLAVEPEPGNVVSSAQKAEQLLRDMRSPWLKIILDPANLVDPEQPESVDDVVDEALDLLGDHTVLAHAKDRARDGRCDIALGAGVVDFPHFLDGLRRAKYDGPLILHGMTEAQVPASVAYLKGLL